MKESIIRFKAGNYITSPLEQIANNIILFKQNTDSVEQKLRRTNTLCSNISGIYDCHFKSIGNIKKKNNDIFLVQLKGNSMLNVGIKDGDILLVDTSSQAVNNSIIVAEINDCICIKTIKFLKNKFILFSENEKYPPIQINNDDNFLVWGVVRTKVDLM